jgi:hypothetical protein
MRLPDEARRDHVLRNLGKPRSVAAPDHDDFTDVDLHLRVYRMQPRFDVVGHKELDVYARLAVG